MNLLELVPVFGKIIDRIFPDKAAAEREKLAKEMALAAQELDLAKGQLAANEKEAAHASLFVAGWRPMIGWVCGLAFAYNYVVQPLLIFLFLAAGQPLPVLPVLDLSEMMPVLLGMLGLGIYRTYEKVKGVNR